MTGGEVLALAASHGIRVTLELGDLHLEADHEPRAEALIALCDHKEAVVAVLSKTAEWAGEWCRTFEDHVATVMRASSLPRPEAERAAHEIVLVEFLNATHPNTDPSRCVWCGQPEKPDNVLLPFGVSTHAWLHQVCRDPWADRRRAEAIVALAAAGMVDSDAKCNSVDSIGSSTKSRVSHSERRPSARFPGGEDGSARRNIEPLQ